MGIGDAFRAAGLSFADCGFLKLNAFFPVMLGLAHASVAGFCKGDVGAAAVAAMPVPAAKVPRSAVAPNGYESQRSRSQKAPGAIVAAGNPAWIERVQAAQYNTWEATIGMLAAWFVAKECGLAEDLFAKLATLFLGIRVAYPVVYALDLDLLRTQLWLTGLYATAMIAFAALFPDTVAPLLA
ncbi:MAPEG-like protein [Aureococcus anophagefferens]|nr:MAPEG-like protein [Aureococcus anophagefferens]